MRLPLHFGVLVGIVAVEIFAHQSHAATPPVLAETDNSLPSEIATTTINLDGESEDLTNTDPLTAQEIDSAPTEIVSEIQPENIDSINSTPLTGEEVDTATTEVLSDIESANSDGRIPILSKHRAIKIAATRTKSACADLIGMLCLSSPRLPACGCMAKTGSSDSDAVNFTSLEAKKSDTTTTAIVPEIVPENTASVNNEDTERSQTNFSDEITKNSTTTIFDRIPIEANPGLLWQPTLTPKTNQSLVLPTPISQQPNDTNNVPITVQRIEVTGNTILSSEQIQTLTQPLEGKTVSFQDLIDVTKAINKLYAEQGYTTFRAVLEQQTISEGIVRIQVIEGNIEDIQVEGNRRLNANYIISRVKLGIGTPLNSNKLEEQLKFLRGDPLFERVEAKLSAGSSPGQSVLVVRVVEADRLDVTLSADNYSPPSIGSERLGVNARYLNVTGIGDIFTGSYHHTTTSGSDSFDFTYKVPLNPQNGTLQLRVAPSRYRVTQEPFDVFDIHGDTELYEVTFRQPLVRQLKEEFALSLGFAYQNGQTFTFAGPTPFGFGPDDRGVSTTSVVKFGQDYTRWDSKGAWSVRSQFSLGTGLFDATKNSDSIPDGRFFSWLGQVQRLQRLGNNNILIAQLEGQLTPDSLLPSQQFVIGGGQSVRGYRQNVRAGDNGVKFSIEDRITLKQKNPDAGVFQLAPFADFGVVWNAGDNPNKQPDQTFIAGVGLGLIWQATPNLNIRLDYAAHLVDLDDRGHNAQDDGFYFSVKYQF